MVCAHSGSATKAGLGEGGAQRGLQARKARGPYAPKTGSPRQRHPPGAAPRTSRPPPSAHWISLREVLPPAWGCTASPQSLPWHGPMPSRAPLLAVWVALPRVLSGTLASEKQTGVRDWGAGGGGHHCSSGAGSQKQTEEPRALGSCRQGSRGPPQHAWSSAPSYQLARPPPQWLPWKR